MNTKTEIPFRYYLTRRPRSIGTIPNTAESRPYVEINAVDFDTKTFVDEIGRDAWGYVEYKYPLSEKLVAEYELTPCSKRDLQCKKLPAGE